MNSLSRRSPIPLFVILALVLCAQSNETQAKMSQSDRSHSFKNNSVPFMGTALIIDHSSLSKDTSNVPVVEQSLKRLGFQVARISAANKKTMLDQVNDFTKRVPTNSQLLVYYVGPLIQGEQKIQSKYLPATYLVPKGFKFKNPKEIRSVCVGLWELEQIFVKSGCKQFAFFADSAPVVTENDEFGKLQRFGKDQAEGVKLGMFDSKHGSFVAVAEPGSTAISDLIQAADSYSGLLNKVQTFAPLKIKTKSFDLGARIVQNQSLENANDIRTGSRPGDIFVNSIGQVFCWIPAGTYDMGSPESEVNRSYDEDLQTISFKSGFWISKYEVTEREYLATTRRNSRNSNGKNFPYADARNGDANRFAESLNKLESGELNGWSYELPDESYWEYACRAGSKKAFCFGDDAKDLYRFGNFAESSLLKFNPSDFRYADSTQNDGHAKLAPVGSYLPNAWGIHDMHGNVWEWCSNRYRTEFSIRPNKEKPFNDRGKSIRGGSWLSQSHYCRSAMRNAQHDLNSAPHIGFRVILRKK